MYSTYKQPYKKRSYKSLRAKTYNEFKQARKANETFSFVVNSNYVFSAFYDRNTEGGSACVNIWDVLARNSHFTSLQGMFDQVRLDGVKVKLNVTNAVVNINNYNAVANYTIVTAWDKTGLSKSQYDVFDAEPKKIQENEYDDKPAMYYRTRIGSGIVNASTQKKSILNSYQKWTQYQSIYPMYGTEKTQFISTGDIQIFETGVDRQGYHEISAFYAGNEFQNILSCINPCTPFESGSVRFKPCLLVSVFQNSLVGNTLTQYGDVPDPVVFNAEISCSLTFKNLKGST